MHPKKLLYSMIGLFFVGFTFLSPGAVALARQVTATITATFIPPSVTPTTMYNFECPVGTPAGWGTYTPSPLWYLECEYCVWTPTSTALPPTITPTHDGTGTPYPTATVTTTPVYTPTPEANPIRFNPDELSHGVTNGVSVIDVVSPSLLHISYTGDWNPYISDITISIVDTLLRPEAFSYDLYYYVTFAGTHDPWNAPMQCFNAWYAPMNCSAPAGGVVTGVFHEDEFWGATGSVAFFGTYFDPNSWGSRSFDAWLSLHAPYEPSSSTPTPTVTVTPAGYGFCNTVAPVDPAFGFDLFVPDGEPNCDMGWDEFGVGDYTIPAVQICFQPSQFGVIRLFGKDYEVGIYGLAAAAAFLWRYFRTV